MKISKKPKERIPKGFAMRERSAKRVPIENFLNIQMKEICYFLGYLWADGHIHKKTYSIQLSIKQDDLDSLRSIFSKIGDFNFSYKTLNNKLKTKIGTLDAHNYLLKQFLVDNDYLIKSGTSPDKILSKIPEHLKHYWWRGYLDGDGTIYSRPRNSCVAFCSSSEQDWSFVISLANKLGALPHICKSKSKTGRGSFIAFSNKESFLKICNYIYLDYSSDRIGLKRKWLKFQAALVQFQRKRKNAKS